jgi:hypothetical protein
MGLCSQKASVKYWKPHCKKWQQACHTSLQHGGQESDSPDTAQPICWLVTSPYTLSPMLDADVSVLEFLMIWKEPLDLFWDIQRLSAK